MKNKLLIAMLSIILIFITIAIAQEEYVSSSVVQSQFSDPSIKLSFRSWGEGQTTTIRLDDYFIGERKADDRFLHITPPEIYIEIDQETSIATLKARGKWLGTRDVIFTRSSLYNLEKSISELKEFESELVAKRIAPKIQAQFTEPQDLAVYSYIEKVLTALEQKKSKETPEVKATFAQNRLNVAVGKDIDMSVGVETSSGGIATRKPKLDVNVRPDGVTPTEGEVLEEGFPVFLLYPLILIGLTTLIALAVYIKRNKSQLKRLIPRIKTTVPEKIRKDAKEILDYKKEIKQILSNINKLPLKESSNKIFEVIKKFFNTLTHPDYEFTYSEVTKEILEEDLSRSTKNFLIKFSKELENIRYGSKELSKSDLISIANKLEQSIDISLRDISKVQTKEEIKLERSKPILNFVIKTKEYFFKSEKTEEKRRVPFTEKIKNFFRLESKKLSSKELEKIALQKLKEQRQKKIEKRNSIKRFFHDNFGLYKTPEEKTAERRKKLEFKLEKERIARKIQTEKNREKIKKINVVKEFFHSYIGLFKTTKEKEAEEQERLRIINEKIREKQQRKLARRNAIKRFFHNNFNLFKTKSEIEAEVKERLRIINEQKRERLQRKLARKRRIKGFFNSYFGLFKTTKEIEFEKQEKLRIEQEKQRLKQRLKDEKRKLWLARRRAVSDFFHDHLGLFKTIEEKEWIIKTELREKRLKAIARRKAVRTFFHDFLGVKTREEREQLKLKEGKLKLKVFKEKQRLRTERRRAIRKFLHDNFGLYKTQEEKESVKINRLREKRIKTLARRKAFVHFCHNHLGLFKTKSEIEGERDRKIRLKEKVEREKEKNKLARRKTARKILHDLLGLYKTPEDIQEIKAEERVKKLKEEILKEKQLKLKIESREKRKRVLRRVLHRYLGFYKTKEEIRRTNAKEHLEKQRKLRLKERRKELLHQFLHNKLGFYKTSEEKRIISRKKEIIKEEKLKLKQERKRALHQFLHNQLGFYKTPEEKRIISRKKEIIKEEKLKLKQEKRKELHQFLHDKLGFFKTPEEKEKIKEEKKIYRLEIKNKIIEKVSLIRRLIPRKKILPSDELHVLIELEEEAIKHGKIRKAKELQEEINNIYRKIKFHKDHPTLTRDYDIIKNKIEAVKNKLHNLSKQTSFTKKIKSLFSPELEKDKIDEIEFLIKKCDQALKINRESRAQQYYLRIIQLYKKLNRNSKRSVQTDIISLREEIANISIKESLERAHNALLRGDTSTAKKLYKVIHANFPYLPTKYREGLQREKVSLAEKLEKKKRRFFISIPRIPLPEFNILTLFSLEKEKIKEQYNKIKEFSPKIFNKTPKFYEEQFKDYLLARKPRFISIQTDTIPKSQILKNQNKKVREIAKHISLIHNSLNKKDHLEAKEHYQTALELFKESANEIPEEIHHIVYSKLKPLKERILHISLANLLSETQGAIKREEHDIAKQLQEKVRAIHEHLQKNNALPFAPLTPSILTLIKDAETAVNKKDIQKAKEKYLQVEEAYNKLSSQQKKDIYPKLLKIYKELIKN
ncbi:MAG: hypothetical protein KKG75_02745 [Nanoarchaeota archaeon]|nr:hypothetical protein [Nanoarchaeota archaeon]